MSRDFLESMATASRRRVDAARRRLSYETLCVRALATPPPPALRLHPRFDVFAEIKLRSPAAGRLSRSIDDLPGRAAAYAAGGAANHCCGAG